MTGRSGFLLCGVVGVFCLAACANSAPPEETTGAEPSEAATVEARIDDPVICRTQTTTGTRFSKRQCMRQSEWDRAKEASQTALRETERRSRTGS